MEPKAKTKGITVNIRQRKKSAQPEELKIEEAIQEPTAKKKGITIRIRRNKKTDQEQKPNDPLFVEPMQIDKCSQCGFGIIKPKKEKKEKDEKGEIIDKETSCKLCNIKFLVSEMADHKKNINHIRRQSIIKMLPKLTDEDIIKFVNSF